MVEWGDSIVDGIRYARITLEDEDTLLYRQEEGRVLYRTKDGKELLLMDFGLETGDEFVTPQGQRFIVAEKGKNLDNRISTLKDDKGERPMQLRLVTEDGGEEDTWIEGVGSVHWGILPLYLTDNLRAFDGTTPTWSETFGIHNLSIGVNFDVNKEGYKLFLFPIDKNIEVPEYYRMHEEVGFSFIGDTLFIQGIYTLNLLTSYVECVISEAHVDVDFYQYAYGTLIPTGRGPRYFEVKVPNFKTGTYQVGIKGQEHVTLVCPGTDGIRSPDNDQHTKNDTYDLVGRRVTHPRRGIYVRDGWKMIMK